MKDKRIAELIEQKSDLWIKIHKLTDRNKVLRDFIRQEDNNDLQLNILQAENKALQKSVERITEIYNKERDNNQMFRKSE